MAFPKTVVFKSELPGSEIKLLVLEASHLAPTFPPFFTAYIGIPYSEALKDEFEICESKANVKDRMSDPDTKPLYDIIHWGQKGSVAMGILEHCPSSVTYSQVASSSIAGDRPIGDNCYWFGYDRAGFNDIARNIDTKSMAVINPEVDNVMRWALAVDEIIKGKNANQNANCD